MLTATTVSGVGQRRRFLIGLFEEKNVLFLIATWVLADEGVNESGNIPG